MLTTQGIDTLSGFKFDNFNDRQKSAAEARKALLTKFQTVAADPEIAARRSERATIAVARAERNAERRQAAEIERKARVAAEREAAEFEKRRAEEERTTRIAAQVARDIAMAAERKALRDAKYAARKARTGGR